MWTADVSDRLPSDPTPAEIAERIAEIQANWTRELWIERRAGGCSWRWMKNIAHDAPGTTNSEPVV